MIASSFVPGFPPYHARLDGNSTWAARGSLSSAWIQADIGYQTNVSGVVIQGDNGAGKTTDWMTKVKVSTFLNDDNDPEVLIKNDDGSDKVI